MRTASFQGCSVQIVLAFGSESSNSPNSHVFFHNLGPQPLPLPHFACLGLGFCYFDPGLHPAPAALKLVYTQTLITGKPWFLSLILVFLSVLQLSTPAPWHPKKSMEGGYGRWLESINPEHFQVGNTHCSVQRQFPRDLRRWTL